MTATEEIVRRTDGPVHLWFGLSYSNYQVLHRSLMQSMPVQWQERMVACLEELREAFDHVEQAPDYEVRACDWLAPYDMDEATMRRVGVTCEAVDPANPDSDWNYYDREGNELDPEIGRVPVPCADPTPHYNRGRMFIEPRAS